MRHAGVARRQELACRARKKAEASSGPGLVGRPLFGVAPDTEAGCGLSGNDPPDLWPAASFPLHRSDQPTGRLINISIPAGEEGYYRVARPFVRNHRDFQHRRGS